MNTPFDIVLMVGIPGSGKTTFCRERLLCATGKMPVVPVRRVEDAAPYRRSRPLRWPRGDRSGQDAQSGRGDLMS